MKTDRDVGFEPWLGWLFSAFVPLLGSLFAPSGFRIYFLVASGLLFVFAIVTLVRQERRKRSPSARDS